MTLTATKSRPILFSGPMVRAILNGTKTQTRRVVKPQPVKNGKFWEVFGAGWSMDHGNVPCVPGHSLANNCPYGVPGDELWVRETWAPVSPFDPSPETGAFYRADYLDDPHGPDGEKSPEGRYRTWKPSIHMPRWACRIKLEVTGVRVERLNDIIGADAEAEGCVPDWDAFHDATEGREGWDEPEEFIEECEEHCDYVNYGRHPVHSSEHREWERDRTNYALRLAYSHLWESINGPDSWDANPWVWVVEFKRKQ